MKATHMPADGRVAGWTRDVADRGVRLLRMARRNDGQDRLLKLRHLHRAVYWKLWEAKEVRRQRSAWSSLPSASVAVVLPTYRRQQLLIEAVESVLRQTLQDFVIIVVDDGGGDVDGLAHDDRVHVIRLSRNTKVLGVVNNMGIHLSSSRYIALLNDDNTWRPDHLEVAVDALERGADLVYTGMRRHRTDDSDVDVLATPFQRDRMRREFFTDSSTLVFRRFPGVHFDRSPRGKGDPVKEDWEFVWRYSRRRRTELVPRVTVDYLIHDQSYLTDWSEFWREQDDEASG